MSLVRDRPRVRGFPVGIGTQSTPELALTTTQSRSVGPCSRAISAVSLSLGDAELSF